MIAARYSFRNTLLSRLLCAGLAASMAAWSMPAGAQPMGIPSMGSASSAELSPALERTLGAAILEPGRRDPTYISAPDVSHSLTEMGRRLAAHAPGGTAPP